MSLSNSVYTSLREAEAALRNSLAFSARQEKPYVSVMIADMISKIDTLIRIDEINGKMEENFKNTNENNFGGYFNLNINEMF